MRRYRNYRFQSGHSDTSAIPPSKYLFYEPSSLLRKELIKEFFRFFETIFRENNGFRLAYRIGYKTFFMETVHSFPVKRLPCSCFIVQSQVKQPEYSLINFFLIITPNNHSASIVPVSFLLAGTHGFQMCP